MPRLLQLRPLRLKHLCLCSHFSGSAGFRAALAVLPEIEGHVWQMRTGDEHRQTMNIDKQLGL